MGSAIHAAEAKLPKNVWTIDTKYVPKQMSMAMDSISMALAKMKGGSKMWVYEKKLEYPIKIKTCNPKMAKYIISQYGGPDFLFL